MLLLAHKLFSAMLSLLLRGLRPRSSSSSPTTDDDVPTCRHPVVHHGVAPPSTVQEAAAALVVDVDTALLLSGGDLFPYFMLVALEAGGFLRGLLLFLLCPLIHLMPRGAAVRAMAAVSFCGLRAGGGFRAGRAVLPKWLMEDVAAEAFKAGRLAVCVTAMPRVMVDGFLREYLGVETVVGREMKVVWGFYTGFMEPLPVEGGETVMKAAGASVEEESADMAVVGFSGSMEFLDHPLARCCKV